VCGREAKEGSEEKAGGGEPGGGGSGEAEEVRGAGGGGEEEAGGREEGAVVGDLKYPNALQMISGLVAETSRNISSQEAADDALDKQMEVVRDDDYKPVWPIWAVGALVQGCQTYSHQSRIFSHTRRLLRRWLDSITCRLLGNNL
jgi:hypothetical protein